MDKNSPMTILVPAKQAIFSILILLYSNTAVKSRKFTPRVYSPSKKNIRPANIKPNKHPEYMLHSIFTPPKYKPT